MSARVHPATTVRVTDGAIEGVPSSDGSVVAYKGVPFARPPVGSLRWRPPQPPEPWDGVLRTDGFAPHPIQRPHRDQLARGGAAMGEGETSYGALSEDCLYLNVWTGAGEPDERRPVMVWLHHGAFFYGGPGVPIYDGEGLARRGAVVVTVSYRLGRIGFLAHPELSAESEHGASGHYGLLDQIHALEWVRDNIAAFGGDPGCVTIFGLSAGSASVNLLMASPPARGLFHRAIGQSAALMGPTRPTSGFADVMQDLASAEQTGLALGRALGRTTLEELRGCSPADLLAVPPLDLQAGPPALDSRWEVAGNPVPRGHLDSVYPAIDGHVLPRTPWETFEAGAQADVPLLCGFSENEAASLPYITDLDAFAEDARFEYGELADRFLRLFAATPETVRDVSGASRADRVFIAQTWRWVRAHARTGSSSSFYYHWRHTPPVRSQEEFAQKLRGSFHGVELPYVFRNLDVYDWPWTDADRELSETVSEYWVNFARTGDPNGATLPDWSSFEESRPRAIHFGDEVAMGEIPRREQLDFWDDWYEAMRAKAA